MTDFLLLAITVAVVWSLSKEILTSIDTQTYGKHRLFKWGMDRIPRAENNGEFIGTLAALITINGVLLFLIVRKLWSLISTSAA